MLSKRILDELLTSTNHLCRLSLNINGNWSEIPEVSKRNDIIGAPMDNVKEKILMEQCSHKWLFY